MYWGGWGLFQEMLAVLDVVSKKYSVSISNVAVSFMKNLFLLSSNFVSMFNLSCFFPHYLFATSFIFFFTHINFFLLQSFACRLDGC